MIKETKKAIIMEITDVLRDIGMPAHVKGFYYVREAIHMVYHDASLLDHMMDGVYATIAERHQTSMQSVEPVSYTHLDVYKRQMLFSTL